MGGLQGVLEFQGVKKTQVLVPAVYAATQTTAAADIYGFQDGDVEIAIPCGALADTATLSVQLQESDASGSGFANWGTAYTIDTTAEAVTTIIRRRFRARSRKRYQKAVITYGGSGNCTFSVEYDMIGKQYSEDSTAPTEYS